MQPTLFVGKEAHTAWLQMQSPRPSESNTSQKQISGAAVASNGKVRFHSQVTLGLITRGMNGTEASGGPPGNQIWILSCSKPVVFLQCRQICPFLSLGTIFKNSFWQKVFWLEIDWEWLKNPSANAGDKRDTGSIPGLGRSPRGGYGNPLQYSCLENPMDRGAWRATVRGVTKSWTWLKGLSTQAHKMK